MVSNVTAAASPFERGATIVAGYVSRWRSQHKYQKSFYYMDFLYLFYDTYPPASPYPSQEGTRSSSPIVYQTRLQTSRRQREDNKCGFKRHGGSVKTTSVVSNVTAAASPFERGATTVAGYVSRWRSQHKYQKSFLLMDFQYLFYDTYPPGFAVPLSRGNSQQQSARHSYRIQISHSFSLVTVSLPNGLFLLSL